MYILDNGNLSNLKAVKHIGKCMCFVKKWRDRWHERQGPLAAQEAELNLKKYEQAVFGALDDEKRSGSPSVFTAEQVCLLYGIACEKPEDLGYPIADWTPKELRQEMIKREIVSDISASSVARFLKRRRPQAPPKPVLAERKVRG